MGRRDIRALLDENKELGQRLVKAQVEVVALTSAREEDFKEHGRLDDEITRLRLKLYGVEVRPGARAPASTYRRGLA